MSRGTTHHAIRVAPELWEAARVVADSEGTNLSAVIREALRLYVEAGGNSTDCGTNT